MESVEDDNMKLSDLVKFGLKSITADERSTITDEDIDVILEKGELVNETENLEKLEEKEVVDNMYLYEGVDYKDKQKDDVSAFESLIQNVEEEEEEELGIRSARKRKISYAETEAEIVRRKKPRKEDKWKKANYTWTWDVSLLFSSYLLFSAIQFDPDFTFENLEEEETVVDLADVNDVDLLYFVVGDVTQLAHAPKNQNAFIINCVDNSGKWGNGRFFNALAAISPNVAKSYRWYEWINIHIPHLFVF